jgi:hypothetical protein
MLHLNTIFETEGLEPNRIQLIRHKDKRFRKEGKTVFDVWYAERERFEKYQSVQRRKNAFAESGLVASFVVSNLDETLFVGMYAVEGRCRNWKAGDYSDPLWKEPSDTRDVVHKLRLTKRMSEYSRRLVIKPWRDAINIVKRAAQCNPEICTIKDAPGQEQFPTYMKFRRRVCDLPNMFPDWQGRLKDAKGIYLLTFSDGQQYVGSASGKFGFWQRWNDYVRTGHGNNFVLQQDNRNAKEDATVSILEVTGSALTRQEVIEREMNWQMKLGSRAKRLKDE